MATVVFNGTRINASDTNTNWGNYIIGGAAPAAEGQIAYQNSLAVNKKVISTTQRQGVDYNHGSSTNMTAAANRLWFVKVIVADSFSLNTTWGIEVSIGSADTSNYHQYNIAGSGANLSAYSDYPVQGGYLITAIDPNIDTWAEAIDQGGTFNQAAVTWFAFGAQFATGAAKSENVAMDAIDVGTGLTITGTAGTFLDFLNTDQETNTNRWGVVTGSGNVIRSHGMLTIGTSTLTEFADTNSIVLFPDGYHSAGLVGVAVGMSNASSIMQVDSLLIGEGTINGGGSEDTRPDFVVTGTSGTFDSAATMKNFRNITFTSICDVADADLECQLLTQASANISNTVIRTNALISVACLQDPTFGISTDLHDVDFVQTGAGHAIELATVDGTYTFTNLTFTGYGADTTDSAALDVTAGSGITTINFTGTQPTYKTAGATVNFVSSVNVTVNIKNQAGDDLSGVEVAIFQDNAARTVVLASEPTDENGEVATTAATNLGEIIIRARQSTNKASFLTSSSGIDTTTEVITTLANHNFRDGDAVAYSRNGGTYDIGPEPGTYYVNNITATTLSLHTSAANAIADTSRVDLTANAGSETHVLDPVRYVAGSATGTIGATNFSTQITLITDSIATG